MSNHIHAILSCPGQLSNVIRDFKSFTSKSLTKSIQTPQESRRAWILGQMRYHANRHSRNLKYQLWTHENHPMAIVSNHFMDQKLDYIHYNPIVVGLVDVPENYIYSSARNYAGEQCLIEIQYLE